MPLRLLLVRHGLSSFNQERRIQGRNNLSTLTPQGVEQARKTGEALKGVEINAAYSSPLQRATKTTTSLLATSGHLIKPSVDKGLLEVDLTPWSGLTSEEVSIRFPEAYGIWKNNPQELVLMRENGKDFRPLEELMDQAKGFLKNLLERHSLVETETVLLVAHNAILRCLIVCLLGEPNQGFRRLKLDNASLSVFNLTACKNKIFQAQIECLNSTAHLNPPLPKKRNNARLILVRHGETNWNRQGRFQGQIEVPLNENGQTQALAAANFLNAFTLNRAYSSSMIRPKQTAEAILKFHTGLELTLENGLVEISHGLWEGKLESEIQANWPKLLEDWKASPATVQMPEGESINDVWDRAVSTWKGICKSLNSNETALVVAHDAVNKTILCALLGLTAADIWMVKQGNGGINVVDIATDANQPDVVTCINLTSHLGGVLDHTATGAL